MIYVYENYILKLHKIIKHEVILYRNQQYTIYMCEKKEKDQILKETKPEKYVC